jgi:hypothetical protein
VFDWLKKLFDWQLPPVPELFGWVKDLITEYAIKPTKRVIQELYNAFLLIGYVIGDVWNRREEVIRKLLAKLQRAASVAYLWAKDHALGLYNLAIAEVNKVWNWINGIITPALNWLQTQISSNWSWLQNWISSTYNNFVSTYNTWKAWIDARLAEFAAFTRDMVNYWAGIYNTYKQRLTDFLSDPAVFIVAWLIDQADRLAEDMRQLAVKVLDKVW